MTTTRKLRILGVELGDANDVGYWSGTPFHIYEAFRQCGCEVVLINRAFELKSTSGLFSRVIVALRKRIYRILGSKYDPIRDPNFLIPKTRRLEQEIKKHEFDVIFSTSTMPFVYMKNAHPKYFWTDAYFTAMVDYYLEFSGLSKLTLKQGRETERRALKSATAAIFSSDWAKQSASQEIGTDEYIHVVEFGASIATRSEPSTPVPLGSKEMVQFLFVGTDWERKGGQAAVAVVEQLNKEGYRSVLHVVGVNIDGLPECCKVHGFLRKSDPDETLLLNELFSTSHFFILPTAADCTPVVFPEASAFGLPSLSVITGGVSSAVKEGVNGHLFPRETFVTDCVEQVKELYDHPDQYLTLRKRSFDHYQNELNWESAATRVLQIMQKKQPQQK